MEIVTTAQMRELDRRTIELGTPGLTLMERAGEGVVAHLMARFARACRRGVAVVAGRGNNGGDGFVVARLLRARRIKVAVVLLGERARVQGDAKANLERWVQARGRLIEVANEAELAAQRGLLASSGVIVDAIFGTGLNAPVSGLAAAAIAALNAAAEGALPAGRAARAAARPGRERAKRVRKPAAPVVVAVDLPSGLEGDTGEPLGAAVRAASTVTFAFPKLGLVLPAARPFVGELGAVDIGIAAQARAAIEPVARAATDVEMARLVPARRASGHKGSHGHVLVIAGSVGKSGAAALAGRAAIRAGAGLTTVACPAAVQPLVAASLPELMTEPTDAFAPERWGELLRGRSAAVVGPGLGVSTDAVDLVRWLARTVVVPLVIDADGLNALAGRVEELRAAAGPRVLTPHPGEMSRLCGRPVAEIQRDRLACVRALAAETGAIVVLKGAGTITAAPDGAATVNTTGGPLLGTGGTGDVLAGLTGSLLAQGVAPYDAARLAVFLHGRAGDRLTTRLGDAGLLASELADELPAARAALVAAGASPSVAAST